jgi:inner membrane protein involved in colicin E2 resistance
MSDFSILQSDLQPRIISRSMGMKLILVSVLALLMTIPSFFVRGLVDDRAQRAESAARQVNGNTGSQQTLFGSSIRVADTYQSVTRSLKYVLLFLGLVFLTYFVFEATSNKRVHPAQYVLVGTAQIIFFLLLLSLAEKVGFDFAFLLAGGSTVTLLSANAGWIFSSRLQGTRASAIFSLLYVLIYLLLRLQDDALLIGAVSSFVAVAAAMYFTRGIDWYSQFAVSATQDQQSAHLTSKDLA